MVSFRGCTLQAREATRERLYRIFAIFCLVFVAFVYVARPVVAAEDEMVISYFESPFQNMEKAIISEAYKRAGIPAKFVVMPGKRALLSSSKGIVDAEANRIGAIDAKYPTLVKVPTPMHPLIGVAFAVNPNLKIDKWEDLKPYKIGVLRGVPFYEKPTRDMHRIEVNSYEQLFKMLERGRVDVVIGTTFSGEMTIKKFIPNSRIRAVSKPLLHIDTFHYVHEKNKAIVPLIDKQLKAMSESGRMAEIVSEQMVSQVRE